MFQQINIISQIIRALGRKASAVEIEQRVWLHPGRWAEQISRLLGLHGIMGRHFGWIFPGLDLLESPDELSEDSSQREMRQRADLATPPEGRLIDNLANPNIVD